MKNAESQGKFQYNPDLLNDHNGSSSIRGIEKEEKLLFKPSEAPASKPAFVQPPPSSVLPTPLVPTAASVQTVTAPPAQQQNHFESADEFLDPELDLELDGMNLDGDDVVRNIL